MANQKWFSTSYKLKIQGKGGSSEQVFTIARVAIYLKIIALKMGNPVIKGMGRLLSLKLIWKPCNLA